MSSTTPVAGEKVTALKAVVAFLGSLITAIVVNTQGAEQLNTWVDWVIVVVLPAIVGAATYGVPNSAVTRRGA